MKESYTLADLRQWHQVKPAGVPVRLGLLGSPVEHSLSPAMQNAALRASGIEMRYVAFRIERDELTEAIECLKKNEFLGANLTIPHKVAGAALAEELTGAAVAIGAINTLKFSAGKSSGSNTDAPGFSRAIFEEFGCSLARRRVLLLGAGGATRAWAFQCGEENCAELLIANRTAEKAEILARETGARAIPWNDLAIHLPEIDVVVNATSLGLNASDPIPFSVRETKHDALIVDAVYGARRTRLVRDAEAANRRVLDGRMILLHQGALAFERWFERPAPLSAMRAAITL